MDSSLEQIILSEFSHFFIYSEAEKLLPFPMFGFEISSGWFPILYEACKKLDELHHRTGVTIQITQVKEKFGGLRLYLRGPEEAYDIEQEAEEKSLSTCDICGRPGKKRNSVWIITRCDKHAEIGGGEGLSDKDIQQMIDEAKNGTH